MLRNPVSRTVASVVFCVCLAATADRSRAQEIAADEDSLAPAEEAIVPHPDELETAPDEPSVLEQGAGPSRLRPPSEIPLHQIKFQNAFRDQFFSRQRDIVSLDGGAVPSSRTMATWVPDDVRYRRLYFEEPMLERHGVSRHPLLRHAASAWQFGKRAMLLPGTVMIYPPGDCQCPEPFGKPGSPQH